MGGFERKVGRVKPAIDPSGSAAKRGPGKQTLAEQLPDRRDVRRVASSTPAKANTTDGVQHAASEGVAGGGGRLPHAATIQSLFGRHDISGIEAHVGGPAATASRAIGAEAYATGSHVAFTSEPSLHTAAHEAAHVVQQRGGVQLKGGVGEAGDTHEQHANQVADRVVAGQSAEDLLDRYSSSSSAAGGGKPAVQRQPTGSPPTPTVTTPGSGGPDQAPQDEAYHASSSAHDPAAPRSRNAGWDDVRAAAAGQQDLDIAWIDSLPKPLQDSIDEGFADSVAEASVAHAQGGENKKIDKEIDQKESELRTTTVSRLAAIDPTIAHKHGKALEEALAKDQDYVGAKAELERQRTQRKEDRNKELRATADGEMQAGSREDSVTRPSTAKVTRLEGKALARTNFMSWAVDVLGSSAAAKQHFLSIHEVSRQPGMFLIEPAKVRFEAARAEFEAQHPGYLFPSTDVAQSMRSLHQARKGIGMLGHALGVAFDFMAYDNPNQKLGETDHYGYLLNRFGGSGDTRGRSNMTLGGGSDDTIAQMGRDTAAGRSTTAGQAMIEKIQTQFDEMVATSERFKSSMAAQLPELSSARDEYFNAKETEKQLAQAIEDEKNADKIAAKQIKAEKIDDAAAKAARREEIKQELTAKKAALKQAVDAAKQSVDQQLAHAFAAWEATINADIADAHAREATSNAELAAHAKAMADLAAIDVHAPDAIDALHSFADQNQLKKPKQTPRAAAYKVLLKSELAAKQKPRDKSDSLSPEYIRAELAALEAWQKRIHDPKRVFGDGKVVAAPAVASASSGATGPNTQAAPPKHWATQMKVVDAPIMQLIEHGFIRHDDMPTPAAGADKKQVFNAAVATTLARYGFSPGASFRDTMHFDFIAGYSAAPGGRSQANMKTTKYGPSGDLPAPASKPPAVEKKASR